MLAKDTFLQTKDMFGALVMFKHKKHLVRVRKRSCFGFKAPLDDTLSRTVDVTTSTIQSSCWHECQLIGIWKQYDTYCGNVAIRSKGTKFYISMIFRTNVQSQHLFLATSSGSWWVNTSPTYLMFVCALHLPSICVLHLNIEMEMFELLITNC